MSSCLSIFFALLNFGITRTQNMYGMVVETLQFSFITESNELLAPWKKRSIAFEFWACSRDHLERPDKSRDIMFFSPTEELCFKNECFRKNFPPWEINRKGYYRNHWTVTILSNWFPTVQSSSVSIHFEAKLVLLSAKRTLCHVTNLAAPDGHVSEPNKMQSIVFFRVLTVQWFQ